ncbi:MAG: hypothetical protein ACREJC_03715 [Tepidisphaeraceae bacterium]
MLALSLRQPCAEEILRGIKAIEYRTRRTTIIGNRFYSYAAKGRTTKARSHGGADDGRDRRHRAHLEVRTRQKIP